MQLLQIRIFKDIRLMKFSYLLLCSFLVVSLSNNLLGQTQTDEKAANEMQKFSVAGGWLNFSAPADWKKQKPRIDFIHADFTIPKTEGDKRDGRITFSHVGGTLEDNLARWIGQFRDVDATDEKQVKRQTKEIDGTKVHMITIQGTFLDSAGGPFGPKTAREKYVLVGAAVESDGAANVYIKAYGPENTMKANKKKIETLMAEMKATDG